MPPTKIHEIADFDVTQTLIDSAAQQYVANFLATFQEFPPRQNAASFSLEQVMEKLIVPNRNQ